MCLLSCGDQQPRVQRDLSFRDHLDKIYSAMWPITGAIYHLCFCLFICLFNIETDGRFRLTEDLLEAEREFLVNLRTIHDVYERPLRKLCSISDEEKRLLFGGVEPILSVSNMLLTKANNIQFNIFLFFFFFFFLSTLGNKWLKLHLVVASKKKTSRLASSPIHTKCHLIFPPD